MADSGTISRIGNILKNTYGPGIVEQQNKKVFLLDTLSKMGDGFRAGGDHYEFPARVAGARAAVQPQAASDALPTATRQNNQKFLVYDKSYFGVIRVYDKDVENSKGNDRAFVNHLDDEVSNMLQDIKCVQNIDLFGDGSGMLATIQVGATSATQTLLVSTAWGGFGSRYLNVGDKIDIYDSTLVTSRTSGAGVTVSSITPSASGGNATVVLSGSVSTPPRRCHSARHCWPKQQLHRIALGNFKLRQLPKLEPYHLSHPQGDGDLGFRLDQRVLPSAVALAD
jgi:hypothetical protein